MSNYLTRIKNIPSSAKKPSAGQKTLECASVSPVPLYLSWSEPLLIRLEKLNLMKQCSFQFIFCCCHKCLTKHNLEGKRLCHPTTPSSQSVGEGRKDRNLSRIMQCCFLACSACFLLQPKTTSNGTTPKLAYWTVLGRHFLRSDSLFPDDCSLYQVAKTKKS